MENQFLFEEMRDSSCVYVKNSSEKKATVKRYISLASNTANNDGILRKLESKSKYPNASQFEVAEKMHSISRGHKFYSNKLFTNTVVIIEQYRSYSILRSKINSAWHYFKNMLCVRMSSNF